MSNPEVIVVLHDIRSSENVGSILRTSDASGVSKVYLTGYTPAPVDRFGRKNSRLEKSALGAESFVPWEKRENIAEVFDTLRALGVRIVAVEQSPNSIPYDTFAPNGRVAYVFGNEVEGLPESVLSGADTIIEIPMRGQKESLNVSVAAGIVLFNTTRRQ